MQKSCYLVRLDPPLPRWQNLGLPFQWVTWATILTALALTGPALFLLARASTGSRWEGGERQGSKGRERREERVKDKEREREWERGRGRGREIFDESFLYYNTDQFVCYLSICISQLKPIY